MTKKCILKSVAVFLLVCGFGAAARCADLKDPKVIIKKSQDYVLSADSFSYAIKGEGWDLNAADTAKRTSVVAGEAASKFKAVSNLAKDVKEDADKDKEKPQVEYKRYHCEYKFKKPYLLQMHVIMSEYVPKLIWDSLMTYRPDKDPAVFWFKPKISPFAIKRAIDSESGDFLYAVMVINYAMMDAMSKDTKPVFKGTAKVGDKDTYVIEFAFDRSKKFKPENVDFKKWGIPKEAQKKFGDEVNAYKTSTESRVVFYFDKETLLILQRESYDMENKLLGKKVWYDIKVNTLSENDF